MLNPTLALFRQAVLARKAVLRFDGDPKQFAPVIRAYWAASVRYADSANLEISAARRLINIAAGK